MFMRALLVVASIGLSGCAVHELHYDQDKIRCALLQMYTDQIMDNLIRASNGMPIIQLDYNNATATITVKETASTGGSYVKTHSDVFNQAVAVTAAFTRTAVSTFMGSLGGEHTNQVAVSAAPVTTSNELYDAYLTFLTFPNSLQSGCCPPAEGTYHIVKKCGDTYYWVPMEFKKQFLQLSLATTAQRGKLLAPPDEFFSVTVKELIQAKTPFASGVQDLVVRIDKKVPNDAGRIEFALGGKNISLLVTYFNPENAIAPAETDAIVISFDPEKFGGSKDISDLRYPFAAKLFLQSRRPQPPTTTELLDRVQFQLQQINFNQLRTGNP